MKILLVNKYWYLKGGTERALFLTKQLLEESGHTVEIFGMKSEQNIFDRDFFVPEVDYEAVSGFEKLRAARNTIFNTDAKAKFKQVILNFRPDIIHFHNIYHQLSFSLVEGAFELQVPMVLTLHDYKMFSPNYTMFHHGEIDESALGGQYYRCLLNNCMESFPKSVVATAEAYYREYLGIQGKIDRYIAPSNFVKDIAVRSGWKENSLEILANPIESKIFDVYREGDYVAYTGRLSEEKGVEFLIAAAKETPEIDYAIAGAGPSEVALRELVLKLELKNVRFVGWLDGEELFRFIGEARCLVVPSVWYENYPYSILRPQQIGKVVLGSRIGGIPEMLPENCLFEPKNVKDMVEKIRFWYNAPQEERVNLAAYFQKQVAEKNSPSLYLEKLLSVYTSVLEERNKC